MKRIYRESEDFDFPEISIPGATNAKPDFEDDFFQDQLLKELGKPNGIPPKSSRGISPVFLELAGKYGLPAIFSIAGSFLGIPAPISLGLGKAASSVLFGATSSGDTGKPGNMTSIAKTLISTVGNNAPRVLDSLLTNSIHLLDTVTSRTGDVISGLARGAVGLEREIRDCIVWYQENKVAILKRKVEALQYIENITQQAEESVKRAPKRARVAKEALDSAAEIIAARRQWQVFEEKITEIWNKFSKEIGDEEKTQENYKQLLNYGEYFPDPSLYDGEGMYISRYIKVVPEMMLTLIHYADLYEKAGWMKRFIKISPIKIFRDWFEDIVIKPLKVAENDTIGTSRALVVNPSGREANNVAFSEAQEKTGDEISGIRGWGRTKRKTTRKKKKATRTKRKTTRNVF